MLLQGNIACQRAANCINLGTFPVPSVVEHVDTVFPSATNLPQKKRWRWRQYVFQKPHRTISNTEARTPSSNLYEHLLLGVVLYISQTASLHFSNCDAFYPHSQNTQRHSCPYLETFSMSSLHGRRPQFLRRMVAEQSGGGQFGWRAFAVPTCAASALTSAKCSRSDATIAAAVCLAGWCQFLWFKVMPSHL